VTQRPVKRDDEQHDRKVQEPRARPDAKNKKAHRVGGYLHRQMKDPAARPPRTETSE
jgi:hypothetical protein